MKMSKWYGVMVVSICAVGSLFAQEISSEQESQLTAISLEYDQRGTQLEGQLQRKLSELALELMRDGRLDSEKAAKESAKAIENRVGFILDAKDSLTLDQKRQLAGLLELN